MSLIPTTILTGFLGAGKTTLFNLISGDVAVDSGRVDLLSTDIQSILVARLDRLTRRANRGGTPIELRPREFALLEYLMRHPGKVMSKAMIVSHVWDYSFDPDTNVVDVLVHRLRAKVDPEHTRIETLRGVGYVLRA